MHDLNKKQEDNLIIFNDDKNIHNLNEKQIDNKKQNIWTVDKTKEIIKDIKNRKPLKMIANKYNMSNYELENKLKEMIMYLYNQDHSINEICDHTGLVPNYIIKTIQDNTMDFID
jgi:hypothetical protein